MSWRPLSDGGFDVRLDVVDVILVGARLDCVFGNGQPFIEELGDLAL
jgi:hypothetical protein